MFEEVQMDNLQKFFIEKASVFDIKMFCEMNNYSLVIFDTQNYRFEQNSPGERRAYVDKA